MPVLDLSEFLNPGQVYTFTFQESDVLFNTPSVADLTADMQNVPYLSNVQVTQPPTLGSVTTDITFTFNGDGSTVVANVQGDISAAVQSNHLLVNFNFVQAVSGATGLAKTQAAAPGPLDWVSNVAIYAAVIIGLLVLFEITSTVKEVA